MIYEDALLALHDKIRDREGIYEKIGQNGDYPGKTVALLPLRHAFVNARIEITIGLDGTFIKALPVLYGDTLTITPATEESNGRSSDVSPHLLCDNLEYVAGDIHEYFSRITASGNDNSAQTVKKQERYREQLKEVISVPDAPKTLKAVYGYVTKGNTIKDILSMKDPVLDKILGIDGDSFKSDTVVRFRIIGAETEECWKDLKLFRFWQEYCDEQDRIACKKLNGSVYSVSGEKQAVSHRAPSGMLGNSDVSKLYSSNCKGKFDFTYRGRVKSAEDINRIGRVDSQKIFSVMRYLYDTSSIDLEGLILMIWSTCPAVKSIPFSDTGTFLQDLGDVTTIKGREIDLDDFLSGNDENGQAEEIPKEPRCDSETLRRQFLEVTKLQRDYLEVTDPEAAEQVLVIGLRKTMPDDKKGRVAVVEFGDMTTTDYFKNLLTWHSEGAWTQIRLKKGGVDFYIGIPGLYEMAKLLFGTKGENGYLELKRPECSYGQLNIPRGKDKTGKAHRDSISMFYQRMLRCMVFGEKIPESYLKLSVERALKSAVWGAKNDHKRIMNLACVLISKKRGRNDMGKLDEELTDRSYLFGRLVAIAQRAESSTFSSDSDKYRNTNAERMMEKVFKRPADSWRYLFMVKLQLYLKNMDYKKRRYYMTLINSVASRIAPEDFTNKKCSSLFILGYNSQMDDFWKKKKVEAEKEEEDTVTKD